MGNADVDKRSCEACHGPAKGHVDFYLNIQKLNEAGKEDEATALMNDTAKAADAKMRSFKEMSSSEASATCLKCHEGTQGILDTNGTGIGTGTPSFHDINNPRYANCAVCHFEIHGSNKDPFFR